MSISRKRIVIIIVLILALIFVKTTFFQSYSGPAAISDPIQSEFVKKHIIHVDLNGKQIPITLIATYEGSFGVKGVKNYSTDGASVVSPRDFILAWGELLKEEVDDEIDYSQLNRWYHYTYSNESLVSSDYISSHSSNTHIIPAERDLLKTINKVKKNDYITLEGYLAIVHFDTGDWSSSMTRNDTGDGACEIFYVTDIIIH